MKIMFQIFIVSYIKLINRAEETDLKLTNFTHEKTETISSFTNSTTVSIKFVLVSKNICQTS
jgi:hypothetical protein